MEEQEPATEVSNVADEGMTMPDDCGAPDPFLEFAQGVAEGPNLRRRNGRRLATIGGGLALVLVVSLVAIGVSGPGSKEAAAQVELGARTTLAAGSATMTVSGSFTANGQTIPITGSGLANLSTNVESLTISFNADGTALNET
jgi:hypothetical protein